MDRKITQLQDQRKKMINAMNRAEASPQDDQPKGGKNKKKRGKQVNNSDVDPEKLAADFNKNITEEIEKLKKDWEAEKKALAEEKEKLQAECKEI